MTNDYGKKVDMDAPYLELLDGPDAGKQFPLVENEKISVGRLPDCSIILSDGSVSRLHSSVEMTNEKVEAADNESRNGTFVNEEKIQKKELRHEDILRCGDIRFRVILGQARWAKQVVEALQTTSDTTGPGTGKPVSTGEIRLLGWPYIIQTLSEHKCSARMVLAYRGQKGEVCFHQGKIFKASLLRFAPLQALLRMTSWDKALFILFQYLPVNKGQTNQELEGALDECLKQRDELQDILNSWAGPCPKFMTLQPLIPKLSVLSKDELDMWQSAYQGSTFEDMMEDTNLPPLEIARKLQELMERHYIVMAQKG